MPRVRLEILRGPYQAALARGIQVESCRLLTDVSLRSSAGWSQFRPAILDTGAPLCLLPRTFWTGTEIQVITHVRVGGLVRKAECLMDVTLGVVTLAIRDASSQIAPLKVHALLSDSDDVSALLGMRGIMTDLRLYTNIRHDEAYLET